MAQAIELSLQDLYAARKQINDELVFIQNSYSQRRLQNELTDINNEIRRRRPLGSA